MLLHASVFTNILNYQTITVKYLFNLNVKVAVSRDFLAIFFSIIEPIWAPDTLRGVGLRAG